MKNPLLIAVFLLGLSVARLYAQQEQAKQDQPPPSDKYVSREEYEKLKSELDQVKAQMAELMRNRAPKPVAETGPSKVREKSLKRKTPEAPKGEGKSVIVGGGAHEQLGTGEQAGVIDELRQELARLKEIVASTAPGTTKFLLTGYAFGGFETGVSKPSTFNAGFSPIFLWKISDKLFFEGELELGLSDQQTDVNLEYAHLTYLLNDYITIGVGKFLTPFGQFPERLHPAWINKLPDFPLAFNEDEGLVPFSQVGAQLRGAIPIGPTKLLYSAYVSNGPRLNTDNPDAAGSLEFDNFTDNDHNKAVGGRIGFLPIPELEVGYSILYEQVHANGASPNRADVLLQGVDASYAHDIELLKGGIDLRVEWVWSHVSKLTYDPTGSLGFGPLTFDNERNGGYVQLGYRPYKIKLPIIEKLEGVFRYDMVDEPNKAPGAFDEQRWTFGLNYWLNQSTVIKAAYEFGHKTELGHGRKDVNEFLLQAAMGF